MNKTSSSSVNFFFKFIFPTIVHLTDGQKWNDIESNLKQLNQYMQQSLEHVDKTVNKRKLHPTS